METCTGVTAPLPRLTADFIGIKYNSFHIRCIICRCTASALDAASDNPLLQFILEEREEDD